MNRISILQVLLATMMAEMEQAEECRVSLGKFKNSKGKSYQVHLVASSNPGEMNKPAKLFSKSKHELLPNKLH